MANVTVFRLAEEDMSSIFLYITQDSTKNAIMILDKLEKAIEQLAQFPLSGSECRDDILRAKGYRKVVVEKLLILYTVTEDTVNVMRVVHGASKYDKLL